MAVGRSTSTNVHLGSDPRRQFPQPLAEQLVGGGNGGASPPTGWTLSACPSGGGDGEGDGDQGHPQLGKAEASTFAAGSIGSVPLAVESAAPSPGVEPPGPGRSLPAVRSHRP